MLRAKPGRCFPWGASRLVVLTLLCVTAALCVTALAQDGEIRPSALAGPWYPEDPDELRSMVDDFLAAVSAPDLCGELRALIAPHAGYRFSGYAAAAAFKCIGDQEFARVVILAPAHSVPLRGCSVPAYSAYRTPLGDVPLDAAACAALRRHPLISDQRRAHRSEHSIEIELPFLQRTLEQFSIVPVLVGHLEEDEVEELAAALRPLLDESTLLVASSDFTHYGARFGYQPFASDVENQLRNLDFGAFSAILSGEAGQLLDYKRRTGITACGALPIAVLLAAVGDRTQSMLLSYYNSAQITGDSSESVSYGAFCFARARTLINELEQATLMRLSRDVLNSCTAGGSLPLVSFDNYNVTPAMMRNAGVFVTLRHGERLRGCIGSIVGVSPIVTAVVENTVKSATEDPRFEPVTAEEAAALQIEISILTPLERLHDLGQIRLGVDGLVLQRGGRSGLFLPQVATEQGYNLEQFLNQLCLKAGLPPGAHAEPDAVLHRFQVQKFGEGEGEGGEED